MSLTHYTNPKKQEKIFQPLSPQLDITNLFGYDPGIMYLFAMIFYGKRQDNNRVN